MKPLIPAIGQSPVRNSTREALLWSGDAGTGGAALRAWEWAVISGLALASVGLVYWAVGSPVWAVGFAVGLLAIAAILMLVRRLFPAAAITDGDVPDWSVTRAAADASTMGLAITDRAGRLVCANDLFASWFDGFVTPPGLPVDARSQELLKAAGRAAWRDGSAKAGQIARGPLVLEAEVERSGRGDDYLLWRFRPVDATDMVAEVTRTLAGPYGQSLGMAGVMAALVGHEGRIRGANGAFLLRALGGRDMAATGRDFATLLRIDEQGMLFFEREGVTATPLRLIQIPVDPDAAAGPMLLVIVDEDGGGTERGIAQSYIETLLSLLPFGLAMVDRDGRFLFINRAFCRAADVSPGRTPRYPGDIVVSEDKGALGEIIRRQSAGQQGAGDITLRLTAHPDDPVSIRVIGVRGMGEATVLLCLKDNSEETRLQRQVAQATKMQAVGQLAGGIAHDFNNILTAVLGSCDLMLMRHTPGDGDYDDIQQIRSNANRAASLTRQLLAFSRQQTLRPQILQLADVVSEVSHLLKRLIGDSTVLEVRHGRGVGPVRADPGQLEQVIVNLAVNARDAMPGGGTLTIETKAVTIDDIRRMGGELMPLTDYSAIIVRDTGGGIPADVLPKIFEPFFTTKDVGKGTGLGLSTVYGIVKQSSGFIFPESEEGKGTSFSIYLPVHHGEGEAVVAPPKPAAASKQSWGSGTILLVEDEDMVRAVAERALSRAGYTVVTAANGEEGLERLAAMDSIDLLVSDVVMPTMDGPAMVRAIRAERPKLPVLFMSGYAEEQLRQSIDIADVGFLPKPFSVAQLTEAVGVALAAAGRGQDGEQEGGQGDG